MRFVSIILISSYCRASDPSGSNRSTPTDLGSIDFLSFDSLSLGSIFSPLGSPLTFSPIRLEALISDGSISCLQDILSHRKALKSRLVSVEQALPDMPDKIEKAELHERRSTELLREVHPCNSEVTELEEPLSFSVKDSFKGSLERLYREVTGDDSVKLADAKMRMSAYLLSIRPEVACYLVSTEIGRLEFKTASARSTLARLIELRAQIERMIYEIDRLFPSGFTLAVESYAVGINSILNPGRTSLTRLIDEWSVKRDRLRDIEREIKEVNTLVFSPEFRAEYTGRFKPGETRMQDFMVYIKRHIRYWYNDGRDLLAGTPDSILKRIYLEFCRIYTVPSNFMKELINEFVQDLTRLATDLMNTEIAYLGLPAPPPKPKL